MIGQLLSVILKSYEQEGKRKPAFNMFHTRTTLLFACHKSSQQGSAKNKFYHLYGEFISVD
ncbi:hypothetical protein BGC07_01020 [Piscirickettsia litoralis]|uniref:Transposase n=1 Tax=Piscirickettsia litoralis TaxID=1891921 RepID=A0ABX2ZYX6_9GAMM|nr:hypothetical protein BGC07_01020 [Piscirickettsia litoralis]